MSSALPPVLDLDELRTLEQRHAAEPLMERAGLAAAEVARAMLGDRGGPIVVMAGPGNNGGDAFVVARWLRAWFHDVEVVAPASSGAMPPAARDARDAYVAAGGEIAATVRTAHPALIVDGLFGIGLSRAADGRPRRT